MDDRFSAARLVAQRTVRAVDEPPASPLGDEDQQVGERLPEAERDDVRPRPECREVLLGGVPGGEVGQPVLGGEGSQRRFDRPGPGVEVAEGEHGDVDEQGLRASVEHDGLPTVGSVLQVDGQRLVDDHLDLRGQRGDDLGVEPVEVHRLHEPGGERHAVEAAYLLDQLCWGQRGERRVVDLVGPLVQGRTGTDRPGDVSRTRR